MKKIILALVLLVVGINLGQAQTTYPYTYGFEEAWESSGSRPPGWRTLNYFGSASWKQKANESVQGNYGTTYYDYARSGSKCASIDRSISADMNAWLISPQFTLPAANYGPTLNLWYGSADALANCEGGSFSVLVSTTDRLDTAAYTEIGSFTVEPSAWYSTYNGRYTYEYKQAKVSLASYAGKKVYLAIKGTSQRSTSGIIIDDFSIDAEGGLAPKISNVQASKSALSIDLSWISENIGTHYLTISGRSDTIKLGGSKTSHSLSVAANQTYTIKIWGSSQTSATVWTSVTTLTVTTDCETITTSQGGGNYFWRGTGGACFKAVDKTPTKFNRSWSTGSLEYTNNGGNLTKADDWLLTPPMQVPSGGQALILKMQGQKNNLYHPDRFSVWFIPYTLREDQFESKGICLLPTRELWGSVAEGDSLIIDLASYDISGREGRFAIRAETKGIYASIKIQEIRVQNMPTCKPPVVVNVIDLEPRSAKVRIPATTSTGTVFEIKYSAGVDASPVAISKSGIFNAGQDFEMEDLEPGTNYYVYVRNVCGDDGNSAWTRTLFRTPYVIESFPYSESFDYNVNLELGTAWAQDGKGLGNWTRIDRNGDYGYWMAEEIYINDGSYYPCVSIPWSKYYEEDRDQFLVSPKIMTGETAKEFKFEGTHSSLGMDLSILISEDPTFPEGEYEVLFSKKDFHTRVTYGVNFIGHSIEIPASYKNKGVYVAFRLQASPSAAENFTQFGIRNVTVEEVGDLVKPTNFKIESLVGNTINLAWDGNAPSYKVACFQTMFDPSSEPEGVIYRPTTAKTTSLTLPYGSDYYFYVQAIYPDGSSEWLGYIDTTIGCTGAPIKIPHIETMDSWTFTGSYPLGCWYYYDTTFLTHFPLKDRDGNPVQVNYMEGFDSYNSTPNTSGYGFRSLRMQGHPDTRHSTDLKGKYLVSPPIEFPEEGGIRVAFQARSESTGLSKAVFKVMVSTTGPLPENFRDVSVFDVYTDSLMTYGWKNITVELRSKAQLPKGTPIWVAINIGNGYTMSIDEISFNKLLTDCSVPSDVKFKQDSSFSTANLSVSAVANANASVQAAYQTTSFNPTLDYGNAKIAELDYNSVSNRHEGVLTDMNPGQIYYIWVRSTCNGTDYTDWVGPFKEYGACGPVTVFPYDAPFKKGTATGSPLPSNLCWETRGNYGGFTTYISGKDYYIHSGFDMTLPGGSAMDEWLITPKIRVTNSSAVTFSFQTERYLDEKFVVLVSTTNKDRESFTNELNASTNSYRGGTSSVNGRISYFAASLDEFIGQDIYIAVVHRTENTADTTNRVVFKGENKGQPTKAVRSTKFIIRDFRISENICSSVTEVASAINEDNIATVTWTGNSSSGWIVRYGSDYFIPTKSITGGKDVSVSANSWTVPDTVKPTKQVRFYIRANCSGSTWYGPFFVRNSRPIKEFPYVEDFENWDIAPSFTGSWTIVDGDRDAHTITSSDGRATTALSGNYGGQNNSKAALYEHSSYGNDFITEWNDWLISPRFDFSHESWELDKNPLLDFWSIVHNWYNTSVSGEKYGVYIGESLNTEDMILVDSIQWKSAQSWINKQVYLRDYIDDNHLNESSIYIGLKDMSSTSDMSGSSRAIAFDNFRIRDVGECYPPTEVEIANVDGTTARLLWRDEAGVADESEDGYVVMYAVGAFDPEVASATAERAITKVYNTSESKVEIILEGLAENSTYYVYISPTCAGANVFWSGPYTFKTEKIEEEYPYEQSFDWRPELYLDNKEWTSVDGNGDGLSWKVAGDPYTGDVFVRALMMSQYDNHDTVDEWLISPPFLMPREPKIEYQYLVGSYVEKFDILVGRRSDVRYENNTFDLEAFDVLKKYETSTSGTERFTSKENFGTEGTIFDDTYVGDTVYFVFHMYTKANKDDYNSLSITQFNVLSDDPCANKLIRLSSVGNVTKDSALVEWTGAAGQTEWVVEYKTSNVDTWTVIDEVTVTESRYVFKNLNPETLYNVRVKAVCSSSESAYIYCDVLIPSNCEPIVESNIKTESKRTSIDFVMNSDATGFIIRYAPKNTENWSASTFIERETSIPNLTPASDYTFEIRTICANGDTSRAVPYTYSTLPDCYSPTFVDAQNISQVSATLIWDNAVLSNNVSYIVEWKLATADWTTGLEGRQSNIEDTTLTITNLTPGKNYNWRVKTHCGENYDSETTSGSFTTQALDKYTVTLSIDGVNRGAVAIKGSTQNEFEDGTEITIVATPADGYRFVSWTNDVNSSVLSTTSEYSFTVTGNVSYTANFIETCNAPTSLVVPSQTVDSTELTWVGTALKYEVVYWRNIEPSVLFIDTVDMAYVFMDHLQVNQTYGWKVRAICDEENSDYVSGNQFLVFPKSSISDVNKANVQVTITPNPVTDPRVVTVEVKGATGNVNWTLLDETGKIYNRGQERNATKFQINANGLAKGTYLVRLVGEGWETTKLIIVQ